MNENSKWTDLTWVALDIETTGKYPFEADICEVAAVKWRGGQIVDSYQQLVRPRFLMGQTVIDIHHITNEMVAESPVIAEVIRPFYAFLEDSIILAHHAPFDIGFLTIEFERAFLKLPRSSILCTSLLSRKIFPESPNHRLQTLIQYLGLQAGQAHRALDDAKACLELALRCFFKLGPEKTLNEILSAQGVPIQWFQYSMQTYRAHSVYAAILRALEKGDQIQITYHGGSRPGVPRTVKPISILRNLAGDSLLAWDPEAPHEEHPKRFYMNKISAAAE